MAAVAGDAVHEDHALADLRRLLLRRVDGDVLELAGALDVAVGAYLGVFEDPAVLDDRALAHRAVIAAVLVECVVGDVEQPLLQLLVVHVFGPKVGVGGNHAVERQDTPSAVLVHHLKPHSHVLRLPLLDDAVAELGVVGGGDFLDVEQDALVADDVVGHVVDVVDGRVVADVTRDDAAVGDAHRHTQVVVLQNLVGHPTDPAHPEEMVVADHVGVELVGDPDVVPVGGRVAVFHQAFDFVGMEMTPPRRRFLHLLVTIEVLVMPIVEILLLDEVFVDSVVRQ